MGFRSWRLSSSKLPLLAQRIINTSRYNAQFFLEIHATAKAL